MSNNKKNNGGGTLRNDTSAGGTLRGKKGDTPMPVDVQGSPEIQPFDFDAVQPKAADVKVLDKSALQSSTIAEIELNGIKYNIDSLVSSSTGEAEIYKLTKGGKEYGLKLYYAGIVPDTQVTKTLKKVAGTGFLVDIIDYGTWESPQGEQRFFELMPFYSGGTLMPGAFHGKADALKATAAAMMLAIKTAHDHNILHKDIKPGNFMYTDTSCSQLLLTDFGIASAFSRDKAGKMLPLKIYAQWRTKIYAAPEIYTVIDNEIEYTDDRSDYYSLGMALWVLWSGDKELSDLAAKGERKLLSIKRGESGTLPYPQDMPANLLTLIKGLTVPISEHRWGFNEFERWVKGENVPVYGEVAKQNESTELYILYNGSKGKRATSLAELATLMMEDKTLAAQYLYSGQIQKWVHQAGFPELEAQIHEYVTHRYPTNREAGVLATVYLLDVDMPYIGPTGNKLYTEQEIARDMTHYAVKYLPMMADKDSSLYIYFRSGGIGRMADEFQPMARKGQMEAFKAMWRMIYTLDPGAKFPVYDPRTPDKYYTYDKVEEIVDFFAKLPDNPYDKGESAIPYLLYDDAFIMWLEHRDATLAGKIKSKLAKENSKSKQLYYYVWYLLAPDCNYHLKKTQDKMFTVAQVAEQINREYVGVSQKSGLALMLQNLKDNRLYYYMKSKELYMKSFDYVKYCYDFNTKDRGNQAGPYNTEIATFKAIKALNGKSFYYFPKSDRVVYNVTDLEKIPADEQSHELHKGKFKDWLAVEFQEDPFADLSKKLAYEILLADYTIAIEKIDPQYPAVNRYYDAKYETNVYSKKIRTLMCLNNVWHGIFFVIIAPPLLFIVAATLIGGLVHFADPSTMVEWGMMALFFTIVLRVVQIFSKVHDWLLEPFGENIGYRLLDMKWTVAAIYGGTLGALCWLLETHGMIGRYVLPAIAIALLIYRYVITIVNWPLKKKEYADALNPDVSSTIVEALYYAWHNDAYEFDSETIDLQSEYSDILKHTLHNRIINTLLSIIPVAVLIGCYLLFSPITEHHIKTTDPQRWERVYGMGEKKTAENTAATTYYYADVNSSLAVRKEPSTNATKIGSITQNGLIEVISIENNWAKIKYNNTIGYVNASYIKPIAKTGNKGKATKVPNIETKSNPEPATTHKVKQEVAHPTPEPTAAPKMYTLRSDYNNAPLCSEMSTHVSANVGTINKGEVFEVIEGGDSRFAKIIYNGETYYIRRIVITPVENNN